MAKLGNTFKPVEYHHVALGLAAEQAEQRVAVGCIDYRMACVFKRRTEGLARLPGATGICGKSVNFMANDYLMTNALLSRTK